MAKILLVEDDKSLREIYGVRLLAEGYDIVSAGDGEEALAMAIKERPQLIVSDVMMPKISGFDMLDILRSTTETRDIKVIMMTALSSEDQRARGEQLGADRYLVKSQVGIEDVVRTVHEVLGDAPVSKQQNDQMFSQPAPRPTNQAPQPEPAAQPPASPLPQPTAPFSTPRPAGLGDRVIHPLQPQSDTPKPDVATLMDRELNAAPSEPQSNPAPAPAPAEPSQPLAANPFQVSPDPTQSAPPTQQQPQAQAQPQPPQQPQPPVQAPQPPQPPTLPPAPRGAVKFDGPLPPTQPQPPQPPQQQPSPQPQPPVQAPQPQQPPQPYSGQ